MVTILSQSLVKSSLVVAVMTLISRLMGFARDVVIANLLGVNAATDAFFVAFRIPNFLRRLFAEGAFANAFVPTLTKLDDQAEADSLQDFIDRSAGSLSLVLLLITLMGVLLAPVLIVLFAPGFIWQGGQYALSIQFLQITLPYLLFITLTALAGSILNARGRFAVPALTPVVLNLVLILATIYWAPLMAEPVTALAWGVLLAGILQFVLQFPALMDAGLMPRPRLGFSDPEVRRMLQSMPSAIFGVSVVQINLLVDTVFASFLPTGSISWLYYSDRLVEFPLGMLGGTLAAVILPRLANHHLLDDQAGFSRSLDWGLKWVVLLGLPASIGLSLLSEAILASLFQHQAFTASDTFMASRSLTAFASGLLGFVMIKILVPGFTARHDTQTPLRLGYYSMLANLIFNFVLLTPLAHAGPALATSLAAYLNAAGLLVVMMKRGIYQPQSAWFGFLLRILFANLVMGTCLYLWLEADLCRQWDLAERSWQLLISILGALMVYAVALLVSGMRPSLLKY